MTEMFDSPVFTASKHTAAIGSLEEHIRQRRRTRARRERIAAFVYPVGVIVVLIAIWEMAAHLFARASGLSYLNYIDACWRFEDRRGG